MRLFTTVPCSMMSLQQILKDGVSPSSDTANGHDAVLVSAIEFPLLNEPSWVVEFEVEPTEVYFDCDDGSEILEQLPPEEQKIDWSDKPLATVLSKYNDVEVRTGYGLYVKRVKPGQIKRVTFQLHLDSDLSTTHIRMDLTA
ncbi:hypothetical protein DRO41_05935 [Candidatus Bathyarchaeota archaeon]|nr:MAG: hypothetical protein DRO41_05935 [Candidatus Bathyarchaeota archaeon]